MDRGVKSCIYCHHDIDEAAQRFHGGCIHTLCACLQGNYILHEIFAWFHRYHGNSIYTILLHDPFHFQKCLVFIWFPKRRVNKSFEKIQGNNARHSLCLFAGQLLSYRVGRLWDLYLLRSCPCHCVLSMCKWLCFVLLTKRSWQKRFLS